MQDARQLACLTIRLDRLSATVAEHATILDKIKDEIDLLDEQQNAVNEAVNDVKSFLLDSRRK